jgi:predicted amidohydrolase YtcJ
MTVAVSEAAGTVFVGGGVFTGRDPGPRRAGVAVRSGRVVAVAPDDELRALIGPGTEVVDLAGGLVIAGFQDAHAHPVIAGIGMRQCELHGLASVAEYTDAIATYARSHPKAGWINGGGWSMDQFRGGTPDAGLLDSIVADRPVFLTNRDGHCAWVNSLALALAGVTRDTPDPVDGRIERDTRGVPTGTLHEGAMGLVGTLVPGPDQAEGYAGLLAAQEHLFSLGITGWQDAAVGKWAGQPDNFDIYLRAAADGSLKARVVGAMWWERGSGLEQLELFEERRRRGRVGRFRADSVKIMQDGIAENYTAAMLSPYLDGCGCATANAGLSFVDPALLGGYVTALDRAGFQVHFHALGDRAVRESLDAIEAARKANGPNDLRHHLAHLQVVHPDDIGRFTALGVVANIQPLWAAHEPQMDELTIPFLGAQRVAWQYPFGDLYRAGARLAAGSDWAVSSPNPWWGIHVAVNRMSPPGEEPAADPFLPEQALDLATALRAYTTGSAWVNHLDHITGTVEPGRLADLAVLDRDPFVSAPEAIAETQVRRTYVEGELVYADDRSEEKR